MRGHKLAKVENSLPKPRFLRKIEIKTTTFVYILTIDNICKAVIG